MLTTGAQQMQGYLPASGATYTAAPIPASYSVSAPVASGYAAPMLPAAPGVVMAQQAVVSPAVSSTVTMAPAQAPMVVRGGYPSPQAVIPQQALTLTAPPMAPAAMQMQGSGWPGKWVNQYNSKVYDGCEPIHTPAGRRRALCVGITYRRSKSIPHLPGTSRDVHRMTSFLSSQGYSVGTMSDDPKVSNVKPTRSNLIYAFQKFAQQTSPGDSLFFYYSGHGHQVADRSGDEQDSMDEAIIPSDYESAGEIVDDDLFYLLCRTLPRGSRLTVVMDSCHSGTGLDLPFVTTVPRQMVGNGYGQDKGLIGCILGAITGSLAAGSAGLGFIPQIGSSLVGSMLGSRLENKIRGRDMSGVKTSFFGRRNGRATFPQVPRTPQADIVMFAAAVDGQTAAEDSRVGGVLTNAFLQSVGPPGSQTTFADVLSRISQQLDFERRAQSPVMSSSKPFNLHAPFTL